MIDPGAGRGSGAPPDDHLLERMRDLLVSVGIDPVRLASAERPGNSSAASGSGFPPVDDEDDFADNEAGCVGAITVKPPSPFSPTTMVATTNDGISWPEATSAERRRYPLRISRGGGTWGRGSGRRCLHRRSTHGRRGAVEDREEDDDADDEGRLQLSESFYTLIFTAERFFSLPCAMALLVFAISVFTLVLCGVDLLRQTSEWSLDIPPGVPLTVRVAQYIALFLGVLLEEEIPEAIEVLTKVCWKRNPTSSSFRRRLLLSVSCRIIIGYVFLLVLFVIVVQSDQVLDIFFNMLALQFVEQVDDAVFTLAKRGTLGNHLRNATRVDPVVFKRRELNEETNPIGPLIRGRNSIIQADHKKYRKFLRIIPLIVFVLNLVVLYTGFVYIKAQQRMGNFKCSTILVNFGENIWERPNVVGGDLKGDDSVLLYSFFNGLYTIKERDQDHRPIYVEMNKQNGEDFRKTTPAKFVFCESLGSWVFMHGDLRKSTEFTEEESDCPWLLKSEPVTGSATYDLLSVASSSQWTVWTGTETRGEEITILCDECENEASCNFKGKCSANTRACECSGGYFGSHCELEPPCTELQTDDGMIFTVIPSEGNPPFVTSYGRPVARMSNIPANSAVQYIGSYSGNRWFGNFVKSNDTDYARKFYSEEYHGYWNKAFDSNTAAFSDPTDRSDPIGINWYGIHFRGGDYGPFGYTKQFKNTEAERGYFHCVSTRCEKMQEGVVGACGEGANLTCPRDYKRDHSQYNHSEEQQCVCSNGLETGNYGYFCEFGDFFFKFYVGRRDFDHEKFISELNLEDENWEDEGQHLESEEYHWEGEGEQDTPDGPSEDTPPCQIWCNSLSPSDWIFSPGCNNCTGADRFCDKGNCCDLSPTDWTNTPECNVCKDSHCGSGEADRTGVDSHVSKPGNRARAVLASAEDAPVKDAPAQQFPGKEKGTAPEDYTMSEKDRTGREVRTFRKGIGTRKT